MMPTASWSLPPRTGSSEAALDEMDEGKAVSKITPFWRVVDPKDKVATKIRCGPAFVEERRIAERIG